MALFKKLYFPFTFLCDIKNIAQQSFHLLYFYFRIFHTGTVAHCAFPSILFHGQIVQIAILQLSGPENKKCSPWKVFGTNHPQTLRLLSRRGPRSSNTRLSQRYIGPKMTFCHFLNFCRKKFSGLTIKLLHIFIQLWGL